MASDYCYDIEVKRAMKRHEAGEARVIPVILRPVDWKRAPFGKLAALPKDGEPVKSWFDPDEAASPPQSDVSSGKSRSTIAPPPRADALPQLRDGPLYGTLVHMVQEKIPKLQKLMLLFQ